MVMPRSTELGSIVTGSIMVFLATIIVICGAVLAHKLTGEATATVGLWSLYYAVPGTLCIVAGVKKHSVTLGVALFFNILGIIVSVVATIIAIVFVALINAVSSFDSCHLRENVCHCTKSNGSGVEYYMSCDDIQAVRTLVVTVLIMYILLLITTFTASIFGCMGTCCAPQPVVVVTSGMPVQTIGGGTVIVASSQSTMHAGYPPGQAMFATYSQAPPPGYSVTEPPTAPIGGVGEKVGI